MIIRLKTWFIGLRSKQPNVQSALTETSHDETLAVTVPSNLRRFDEMASHIVREASAFYVSNPKLVISEGTNSFVVTLSDPPENAWDQAAGQWNEDFWEALKCAAIPTHFDAISKRKGYLEFEFHKQYPAPPIA